MQAHSPCSRYLSFKSITLLLILLLGAASQRLYADALLVYADGSTYADDVKAKIDATSLLSAPVVLFDATAGTPDLATLNQYECVMVWSDSSFADSTTLGDNLADYVDGGGGVVIAVFANGTDTFDIDGRWKTDAYYPILSGSYTSGGNLTLGTVAQPGHPVMSGVASFSGGTDSYRGIIAINPQASLIAEWSNGEPLVAEMTGFAGRVVALNFFPPSSDIVSSWWDAATDGDLLMANALAYVCCREPDEPSNPHYPDGAVDVPLDADLYWDGFGGCLVVPNDNATNEGNGDNVYPFNTGTMRYQQIYDATQFLHGGVIQEIRFRPDEVFGNAFGPANLTLQVHLGYAATSVAAPSATFASNIGANYTLVLDGSATLSSSDSGGPPRDFDVVLDVDDLFFYDPDQGPLLLDVKVTGTAAATPFDAAGSGAQNVTTRIWSNSGDENSATGTVNYTGPGTDPYGLVTMFCFDGATAVINPAESAAASSATEAVEVGPAGESLDGLGGADAFTPFAPEPTFVIPATERGWWRSNGFHTSGNDNTLTGKILSLGEHNSYFIFNVGQFNFPVTAATLRLELEGYSSTDAFERLFVYDVSADPAILEADGNDITVYNDLQSGSLYGGGTVLPTDVGSVLEFSLSPQAVADINASGGVFAVGCHLDTIDNPDPEEWVRFSSGTEFRVHELVLTCGTSYDVFFGATNPPTDLICADVSTPRCDPGPLESGTTYYWQVIARNCCGETTGSVWSFATEGCATQAEEPTNPHPGQTPGISPWTDLSWNEQGGCLVSPTDRLDMEGDGNNSFPFNELEMRYQQIYAASGVGQAGTITQIRFRPDTEFGVPFGPSNIDCEIYLGYASNSPTAPSETFANNIGPARTLVFDGILSLSSADTGGPPRDFDIVLDIDDLFHYDPAGGDLLLDIFVFSGGGVPSLDAHGISALQSDTTRIRAFDVNATTGIIHYTGPASDPYGLVTQFCFDGASPGGAPAVESAGAASTEEAPALIYHEDGSASLADETPAGSSAGESEAGGTGDDPDADAAALLAAAQEVIVIDPAPAHDPAGEGTAGEAPAGADAVPNPTSAIGTLIDFDDIPGTGARQWDGNRYAHKGVIFSTSGGSNLFAFGVAATSSPPNYVYGSSTGGGVNDKVIATLVYPANYVSFYVHDPAAPDADFNISLFDSNDNLLQSLTTNLNTQFYEFALPDIRRVEFTSSSDGEGIDDFAFASPFAGCADLGHPTLAPFVDDGFLFDTRSVAVDMNRSVTVTSLGVMSRIGEATTLIVNIHEISGNSDGTLLATASTPVSPGEWQFRDVPINFTFQAGMRYGISFTVPGGWGVDGPHNLEFYGFQNSILDPAFGFDVGPFKILDGAADGSYSNSWMPHIRACAEAVCCNELYGAATGISGGGGGNAPSSLYRIDAASGTAVEVGPIGFKGVSGLSFGPDGTLYGAAHGFCEDMAHPTETPFSANNIGTADRSTAVDVNNTVIVASLGIMVDIGVATDLTVTVYEVTGTTRGAALDSATTPVTPGGLQFHDVPINFTFLPGSRYDIAFNVTGGWGSSSPHQMEFYSFDNYLLNPAGGFDVGPFKVLDGASGGSYGNGVMPHIRACMFDDSTSVLLTIDTATGAGTLVGKISDSGTGVSRMPDISFASDGTLYGYGDSGANHDSLYTIDPLTGAGTLIGATSFFSGGNGMDFAPDGTLYATPSDDGCVVELNTATGSGVCVVDTNNKVPASINALEFCPENGVLYGSLNDFSNNYLVTIDPATGLTQTVGLTAAGLDAIAIAPRIRYDVYFGATYPPTELVCRDRAVPNCPLPVPLNSCQIYYWQVIAKDCCSEVPGPVWVFGTQQAGDLTGDDFINYLDESILAAEWTGSCSASNNWCNGADFNHDGTVDDEDLLSIAANWLESCSFLE